MKSWLCWLCEDFMTGVSCLIPHLLTSNSQRDGPDGTIHRSMISSYVFRKNHNKIESNCITYHKKSYHIWNPLCRIVSRSVRVSIPISLSTRLLSCMYSYVQLRWSSSKLRFVFYATQSQRTPISVRRSVCRSVRRLVRWRFHPFLAYGLVCSSPL